MGLHTFEIANVDVAGLSVAGLSIGEILNGHLGKCPLEIYMSQWTLASVHYGPLLSIVRTLNPAEVFATALGL